MRTGRKRRQGRRHPNGELARPRTDYRAMAALQPHRRWLPEDKRLSEKAGTPLGGLNLVGILTDQQHEAGLRYAVIVGEYRAVIMPPKGFKSSGRGFDCLADPIRCEAETGRCECKARKSRYDAAFVAVIEAGHRAARAVARVAVHGEPCPPAALSYLRWGLDALCLHFGLTANRKSASSGNRY